MERRPCSKFCQNTTVFTKLHYFQKKNKQQIRRNKKPAGAPRTSSVLVFKKKTSFFRKTKPGGSAKVEAPCFYKKIIKIHIKCI